MTKMSVNTYSPNSVELSVGGYSIAGWDNITVARRVTSFLPIPGIRGKHTRVPNLDTSATITLTLIQTSPSNDVLSAIHGLDIINGTGRLVLTLKDKSGRSVFSTSEGYITGYPETVFSGDFEYRTWTIFCQSTSELVVGGNTKPDIPLVDQVVNGIKGIAGNIF